MTEELAFMRWKQINWHFILNEEMMSLELTINIIIYIHTQTQTKIQERGVQIITQTEKFT